MPADLHARIELLNDLGLALSNEGDPRRLQALILDGAKRLTRADGGTIYSVSGDEVRFEMLRTDSLGIALGGPGEPPAAFPPVRLHPGGGDNHASIVAHTVLTGATCNIADAYAAPGFDFSGTRAFDTRTGYHSQSFLTVPMRDHEGVITGVLQLINARDAAGTITAFAPAEQRLIESIASQAATALSKHRLIDGMNRLFESFIRLIATAIDEKSPYTGGHCRRVPELTMLLADAAARQTSGPLAAFTMEDKDRYELQVAAWLHDCGKITTPEWVMDKATKLERIHDRIELVAERFNAAKQGIMAEAWQRIAEERCDPADPLREASWRSNALDEDLAFLRKVNVGGEAMRPEDQQRVDALAARGLITANEAMNLKIPRGTLLPEERSIINGHMTATIRMLESLPYPRHLQRVPEYAGGHHERMDGKGYPKGLTRDQMSVPARIMGIADIFEALTAGDRPYKKAMTLSTALGILGRMKLDGHIDPDLFDVFVRERVYDAYAQRFLKPEQIDQVDPAKIPGWPL